MDGYKHPSSPFKLKLEIKEKEINNDFFNFKMKPPDNNSWESFLS